MRQTINYLQPSALLVTWVRCIFLLKTRKRNQHCFLPSLLLLLTECFQYYQRFHSFIPSTPLVCLICLSDSHSYTHVHTHMHWLTWSQMDTTTLQGTCTTPIHAQSRTQRVCMYPWGGAAASVAAWCFISRTTHYYSNTLLFKCSNVLSILLNQLYTPPEGKQTSVMKKWNDLWMNPLHEHLLSSYNVFFRISVRPFPHFLRLFSCCFCFMKQYRQNSLCTSPLRHHDLRAATFNSTSDLIQVLQHKSAM